MMSAPHSSALIDTRTNTDCFKPYELTVYLAQELTSLGKPKRPRSPFNIFISEHFEEARGTTTQVGTFSMECVSCSKTVSS